MTLRIAIPRERANHEQRVAMDPATAARLLNLMKDSVTLAIETQAGEQAGFSDEAYDKTVVWCTQDHIYDQADLILRVQPPSPEEISQMPEGSTVVGLLQPYRQDDLFAQLAQRQITAFAMEKIPRISRAQSMDALSSQASIAGYRAALLAATRANFFLPMLTTAAGTIRPAKTVVIGAGVAGLQAIATCRRLGAQVEAYDIRPAAREQVESLGARLIETGVDASGEGGYARELSVEEQQQQADALAKHLRQAKLVISTAAIPGKPAPKIISQAMVEAMQPGSVIVDLAAETGGNCELTQPGEEVIHQGVIILGPQNVPSQVAWHASEMYARNLLNFIQPMITEGQLAPDWSDEIIQASLVTRDGRVVV